MCFSAEASFTASTLLSLTGIASLRLAWFTKRRWLALIPLLFAIQQFSEGILWLYLPSNTWQVTVSEYVYTIFAYLFWPIFIPFAIWMAEPEKKRKNFILITVFAGIALTGYFIWEDLTMEESFTTTIVNHSIRYSSNRHPWRAIYAIIVIVPCLVSSLRGMAFFGLLATISYFIAEFYYTNVFVSVWCFFAAILSLMLYLVLQRNQK